MGRKMVRLQLFAVCAVMCIADTEGELCAVQIVGLYCSPDSGLLWSELNVHITVHTANSFNL